MTKPREVAITAAVQISNQKLNPNIEKQVFTMLFRLLAEEKDRREIKTLLTDLLTEVELLAMAKRLGIAIYLDKNRSWENIKNHLRVSSATIAAVAEQMGNPGIQLALRRIKAEEWAESRTEKILGWLRRLR